MAERKPKPQAASDDRPQAARAAPSAAPLAEKVGVYVCHCGGNISDVVDVDRVATEAAGLDGVAVARHVMFMCSDEGQKTIVEDIEALGLDRVVVAACTPKLHETTFRRALMRGGHEPLPLPARQRPRAGELGPSAQPQGGNREGHRARPRGGREGAHARAAGQGPRRGGPSGPGHRRRSGRPSGRARSLPPGPRRHPGREVAVPGRPGRPAPHRLPDRGSGPAAGPSPDRPGQGPSRTSPILTNTEVVGLKGYVGDFTVTLRTDAARRDGRAAATAARRSRPARSRSPNEFDAGLSQRERHLPALRRFRAGPSRHRLGLLHPLRRLRRGGRRARHRSRPASRTEIEIEVGRHRRRHRVRPLRAARRRVRLRHSPRVMTLPQVHRMLDPEGPTGGRLEIDGRVPRSIAFIHCVGSRADRGRGRARAGRQAPRVLLARLLHRHSPGRQRDPQAVSRRPPSTTSIATSGPTAATRSRTTSTPSKSGVVFLRFANEARPRVEAADGSGYPAASQGHRHADVRRGDRGPGRSRRPVRGRDAARHRPASST